jgi:adenylate cyclase
MVAAFIDLTDFTGRSFGDDETEVVDLAHAVLTGFIASCPAALRG